MRFTSDAHTCRGTLILHADGTDECEHQPVCGADELRHEHVVACHEVGCACTGEAWHVPQAA
ncbi:MAG: hypothetical protein AB7H43_00330 [Acidimicrobiia bacterium]